VDARTGAGERDEQAAERLGKMSLRDVAQSGVDRLEREIFVRRRLSEFRSAMGIRAPFRSRRLSVRPEEVGTRMVYRLTTGQSDFVLKMHNAPEDRNPMAREHGVTMSLADHFESRTGLNVPLPVYLSDCRTCFAMQWFEGLTARNLFRTMPEAGERCDTFRRAGAWLRALHGFKGRGTGEFRPLWVFDTIRWLRPKDGEEYPRVADGDDITRFATALRERVKGLRGRKVVTAFSHGDFSANNLLIGETETCGIDFGFAGRRIAVDDIADFLMSDLMFRCDDANLGDHGLQKDSLAAFLDGYGPVEDAEVLEFLLPARIMLQWIRISGERVGTHPEIRFRFEEAQRRMEKIFAS
jgi:Ser/Thr protein kinase RdoA (MazF antagonist)